VRRHEKPRESVRDEHFVRALAIDEPRRENAHRAGPPFRIVATRHSVHREPELDTLAHESRDPIGQRHREGATDSHPPISADHRRPSARSHSADFLDDSAFDADGEIRVASAECDSRSLRRAANRFGVTKRLVADA
jgi:hypothetical protein